MPMTNTRLASAIMDALTWDCVHTGQPVNDECADCARLRDAILAAAEPVLHSAQVPLAEVERLLAEAAHIDPGLRATSLAPIGSRDRGRHERIRDHYIAYGIRHALDNLGLMPDA